MPFWTYLECVFWYSVFGNHTMEWKIITEPHHSQIHVVQCPQTLICPFSQNIESQSTGNKYKYCHLFNFVSRLAPCCFTSSTKSSLFCSNIYRMFIHICSSSSLYKLDIIYNSISDTTNFTLPNHVLTITSDLILVLLEIHSQDMTKWCLVMVSPSIIPVMRHMSKRCVTT